MNSRVQQLHAKYRRIATERAGGFILKPNDALRLVDDVEASGLRIEGVDGYFVKEELIGDSQEDSISFRGKDIRVSAVPGNTRFDKARNFIRDRAGPHKGFDVLFSDPAEGHE